MAESFDISDWSGLIFGCQNQLSRTLERGSKQVNVRRVPRGKSVFSGFWICWALEKTWKWHIIIFMPLKLCSDTNQIPREPIITPLVYTEKRARKRKDKNLRKMRTRRACFSTGSDSVFVGEKISIYLTQVGRGQEIKEANPLIQD